MSVAGMDNILSFFGGIWCALMVAAGVVMVNKNNIDSGTAMANRRDIVLAECEKFLPRNQSCEVVISARIKNSNDD